MHFDLKYHYLIEPFVKDHTKVMASVTCWQVVKPSEFENIISRGINDRMALKSTPLMPDGNGSQFSFSVRNAIKPIIDGSYDHISILSRQSQVLLGHCWEVLRINNLLGTRPRDPVLEFFYHIRNGGFHGNKFKFDVREPKHKAEWKGLAITPALQGKRIFRENLREKDFFLNYGDPLLLLHDVSALIS